MYTTKKWSSSLDDWIPHESVLLYSIVTSKVQENLYHSHVLSKCADLPNLSINCKDMLATMFVGKPFRVQTRLSSSLLLKLNNGNNNQNSDNSKNYINDDNHRWHIRSAFLAMSAALPAGSVTPEQNLIIQMRVFGNDRISVMELTELALFLEDSINKLWLRSCWKAVRACLPTRNCFLKYASFSQVALLIWILDRAIIYDQAKTCESPAPVYVSET